ncbi:VanZ family protein [Saccharopolyspora sp. ASAGF58]|uniref:VanZ family protein n=1 Tax=Saccharopolyspora sp. ASAGF58 TaxID=2719023 RepID=UPI0014400168|nr:VanZ family protein [Saccharopolyspora sp. ASAGF58]QIZ34019.1 VanZ family protein [Saccharopolyspora sp. ASAGF58]
MLDHYRTRLTRILFGVAVLASLVIIFTPDSGVPTAPPGTDKVVHFVLFGALAATGRIAGFRTSRLLPGLVGYAAASEILQGLLPIGRSCEVADGLVDVAGAVAGWAAVRRMRQVSGASSR